MIGHFLQRYAFAATWLSLGMLVFIAYEVGPGG